MANVLFDREHTALFQTYKRLPIAIDSAQGCRITDKDGRKYLDFLGGIAVNALGHSHPAVLAAIAEQSARYLHVSNYFYQDVQIELAEELLRLSGMQRVFFANSGTEAMEGALKLARRWGHLHNRKGIFAFSGGFHGRSYGALSLMDKALYKDTMGPFLQDMQVLPYNDTAMLRESVSDSTCAVVLEFIQGEGGLASAAPEFISTLQELRRKHDFLIIADEIQTGIGRNGTFCAFQQYGLIPDVVLLAKGLGGGLPLGAIVGNEKVAAVWERGMHGTTFGGNALACAAGLAVLKELQNSVMDNVRLTGTYLRNELQKLCGEFPGLILEVRGLGLMAGLQLAVDSAPFVGMMLERGVIINATSGTVIRLVPPLIIGTADIDELIHSLRSCFTEFRAKR